MGRHLFVLLPLCLAACGPGGIGAGIASLFGGSDEADVTPTVDFIQAPLQVLAGEPDREIQENGFSNQRSPQLAVRVSGVPLSKLGITATLDPGTPDEVEVEVQIGPDGSGEVRTNLANKVTGSVPELADGPHTLRVEAKRGRRTGSAKFAWIVDAARPPFPNPVVVTFLNDSQLLLSWSNPEPATGTGTMVSPIAGYDVFFEDDDKLGEQEIVDQKVQPAQGGLEITPEFVQVGLIVITADQDESGELMTQQTIRFGIVAVDEAGNRSPISPQRDETMIVGPPQASVSAAPVVYERLDFASVLGPEFADARIVDLIADEDGRIMGVFETADGQRCLFSSDLVGVQLDGTPIYESPAKVFCPAEGAPRIDLVTPFFDANRDGAPDLVTADQAANLLTLYFGTRSGGVWDGGFALQSTVALAAAPQQLEISDFDRDGYVDVLARARDRVIVLLAAGANGIASGQLGQKQVFDVDLGIDALVGLAGDFDNDTFADYAVLDGSIVRVLFGEGLTENDPDPLLSLQPNLPRGRFGPARIAVPKDGPESLATADFNRDGIADIVTSNRTGTISVLLGRGNRTFDLPSTFQAGVRSGLVVAGQVDGDGIVDVVLADAQPGSLTYLYGNGTNGRWDGTFSDPFQFPLGFGPGVSVRRLQLGDFNGDRVPDTYVVFDDGSSPRLINGPGGFPASTSSLEFKQFLPTFHPVHRLSIADTNGDALADIVAAGKRTRVGIYTLFLGVGANGQSTAKFEESVTLGGGDGPILSLSSADFNADGRPDLAITAGTGIDVQFGAAGAQPFLPDRFYDFRPAAGAVPDRISATAAGDVNHDGRIDMVNLTPDASSINVLLADNTDGRATGRFGFDYTTVAELYADASISFSALACGLSDYRPILPISGRGLRSPLTGVVPGDLALADFDGDGGLDVLVGNESPRGLAILRNFGRECDTGETTPASLPDRPGFGIFELPVNSSLPFTPGRLLVGDFNRDGVPDVVALAKTPSEANETFCVMLGNREPPGATPGLDRFEFDAPVAYQAGKVPVALVAADFDGDGTIDLAILDRDDGLVRLLDGRGDGLFASARAFTVVTPPVPGLLTSLAVGDFNSDTIPDLAVGGTDGIRIVVGGR